MLGAAASGLDGVVGQYAGHGPLVAAFLANMLATFGDKGQLVVILLASRYDWRKVFLGSMGAFALWSAVEVIAGQWIVTVLPDGAIGTATGAMFLLFGIWMLYDASTRFRSDESEDDVQRLPGRVARLTAGRGGVVTSFVFILFAEFGDKTQLLTINLAATFPSSPVAVFVGVVAALALRTAVDAVLGEAIRRVVPTAVIQTVGAVVFVLFGVITLGVF